MLPSVHGPVAAVWWLVLVLRRVLHAVLAVAMGVLVAAEHDGAG